MRSTGPPLVRPVTLLDHVRADLRADRPPTPFARPAADTSIQVHACHGTIRQLEVLRDALGHLFVADPALRPDDVIVICPDLERFEPFAAAVFGRGTLPVPGDRERSVDRHREPGRGALATILHTVAGRCTASDVLAVAALRRRSRRRLTITVDDLDRFAGWTARLGTRWGLDSDHRQAWFDGDIDPRHLGAVAARACSSASPCRAPTPRTGFGGHRALRRPRWRRRSECRPPRRARRPPAHAPVRTLGRRTVDEWCDMLVESVDQFCADSSRRCVAGGRRARGDRRRPPYVGRRRVTPAPSPLAFDDLLAIVDGVVAHRRGRVQLRSGRVAITGSAPVRNVPAKVVCRARLRREQPAPGRHRRRRPARRAAVRRRARSPGRTAQPAARCPASPPTRTLIVTCDGSDVTTNRQIRFAVQLSELLDVVDATLEPSGGSAGDR